MSKLLFALSLLMITPAVADERDGVIYLSAEEAHALLQEDPAVQVLDVRTRDEYRAGHIEGALQINYYSPRFRAQAEDLPSATAYLVHCGSGGRSSRAVRILKDLGIDTIYHLDGGMRAWQAAGLPIVQEEAAP